MQVKVIKTINGLEEGDILNYNEKTHKYEIKKVEEDISDKGYSSKKTFHTYSTNAVLEAKDYFVFIDNEGDEINIQNTLSEVSRIGNITKEEKKVSDIEIKENIDIPDYRNETIDNLKIKIDQLIKENKNLSKQLEILMNDRYNDIVYRNPFRKLFIY